MVSAEAITIGGAIGATEIVLLATVLTHLPILQMAVYVVVVAGVTVMLRPVAPVDHEIIPPSQPAAERVTLLPGQIWSYAQVITGGVTEITTIVLATDGPLTQFSTLQVAV